MQEKIGNVVLDLTWYSGTDLYSDGEVEEKLLSIAQSDRVNDLNRAVREEKDWAVLYHMSHIRENILAALPMRGDEQVLEVGSGCGAVTGALLDKAGHVTCVDLSKRRSTINALRHKEADNLSILVGNFQDIEKHLPDTFDVITLIGVFEYARGYIGTQEPYGEFLRQILSHLKEGGRLVVAIENRLGLKYFAGAAEDHTGRYFDGLENYPDPKTMVRTFSRPELENLFAEAGEGRAEFYYPYPDYKLPMAVYSDDYLPGKGQLSTNIWNFDRSRLLLFDEEKMYDSLVGTGLYPQFANSFLVVYTKGQDAPLKSGNTCKDADAEETDACCGLQGRALPVFTKYSNERAAAYALRTDILQKADGSRVVKKTACAPEGKEHVLAMKDHAAKLDELFAGAGICANKVVGADPDDGSVCFEFLEGRETLEEHALDLIGRGQEEEAFGQIRAYCAKISSLASQPFVVTDAFREVFALQAYPFADQTLPVTDLDMVCENLLLSGDEKPDTLIDFEWTYDFPVPVRFVLFRIWDYFFKRNLPERSAVDLCMQEGFSQEEISLFGGMEKAWQAHVLSGHTPLRELFADITPGCVDVLGQLGLKNTQEQAVFESTLLATYTALKKDAGQAAGDNRAAASSVQADAGSVETQTIPLRSRLQLLQGGRFQVRFETGKLPAGAKLRWDPLENRLCRIRITQVQAKAFADLQPMNAVRDAQGFDMFWTMDPAYEVRTDSAKLDGLTIEGELELIDPYSHLDEIARMQQERRAYYDEMESLRGRLEAIRSTKAYKATEGLRRIRNFTMARVRGTKLFRDKNAGPKRYQEWLAEHTPDAACLRAQAMVCFPDAPKISILVPTYRTPETYLREMIASVLAQSYANWELCIADASCDGGQTLAIIREYANADSRIRVKELTENEGISGNTNQAASVASGDYITLLDHDDLLAPDALFEVAQAIVQERASVLYTDEDKVNMLGTDHFEPNLKPEFSPDLLRAHNYITHLFVVKKDLFDRVGGFRKEFDGAQDYDLIFRCCFMADRVVHIPKILYHWRSHESSTAQNPESKLYAYEAGRKAIEEHLKAQGIGAKVERSPYWGLNHVIYDVPQDALVSIIIPNKDHTEDLDRCIRSIMEKSTLRSFEILVIENNSTNPATFAYYKKAKKEWPDIRILRWEREFNYSAINNFGAAHAKGQYLLLLNNDTQLIDPDSIKEMAGLCTRRDAGCVGAKLLYEDDTVQHAGIVLGFGGFAGHVFVGIGKDSPGFMMRPLVTCNYSAVTAACLMVRKDIFDEVGGLDEGFAVALNDVDFCLRVRQKGYLNIYTPYSLWHHYESRSRGYEDTPEKKARFEKEVAKFRERWAKELSVPDPFYNPNFRLDMAPFSLY